MKDEVIKLTQDMVKVDSTLGKSINAAEVLYSFLLENGFDAKIDNYKEGEANIYAEIGPKNTPAFLISGHVDTVPIGNPNDWAHHPFSGEIIDGELWGRGSVDMKGGTATLAGVMVELLKHEADLGQRVLFAATAEEETGLKGAKRYVKQGKIENISHVLIAEPTDLAAKVREKGIMWFEIFARGKQAHASRPDLGHNAIEGLSRILPKLQAAIPEYSTPDLGRTSLNFGVIGGGAAANVVAETVKLTCDSRSTPGVENETVLNNIREVLEKESGNVVFSMEVLENVPAILSPNDSFAELLKEETSKFTGKTEPLSGVHYATDGAVFMDALNHNVPFVIYGPGSTELLHQTNERLEIKQLDIARQVITNSILHTI